jgi:hypothetical protein
MSPNKNPPRSLLHGDLVIPDQLEPADLGGSKLPSRPLPRSRQMPGKQLAALSTAKNKFLKMLGHDLLLPAFIGDEHVTVGELVEQACWLAEVGREDIVRVPGDPLG